MGTSASFNNQPFASMPGLGAQGAGGGAMPELPTPAQLAPDVVNNASAAPACPAPVPECTNAPTLHTHQIALADPMAGLPSPQQLAPHVFFNNPANPMPPVQKSQPAQQPQPRTPQPPAQQPQQQPQQQQQQTPQQQPQQKDPQQTQSKKAPMDEFDGALSDEVVKTLNRQLNDSDEAVRAGAATDFSNILQKHPKLAENSAYKPYVDAFMEKIMSDPSSLVRGVGEMTMQLGLIKNPSDPVRGHLKKLALKDDAALTKENDQASSILTGLENGSLGADLVDTRKKKETQAGGAAGSGQSAGGNSQSGKDSSATSKSPGVAGGAPPTPAPPSGAGAADSSAGTAASSPGQSPDAASSATADPAKASASAVDQSQDSQSSQTTQQGQSGQNDPSAPSASGASAQNAAATGQPDPTKADQTANSSTKKTGFGSRLNLLSKASHSFLPSWLQPNTGQKFDRYDMSGGQTS